MEDQMTNEELTNRDVTEHGLMETGVMESGVMESGSTNDELTDHELLDQFERATLPLERFRHLDHVRVAFLYLYSLPTLEALQAFSKSLRRFASRHGKSKLYHETITWAYIFLIRERMARAGETQTWEQFAKNNADLLIWKGGALTRFYRDETLKSDLARSIFVLPDNLVSDEP
jgi:hypothetical protein